MSSSLAHPKFNIFDYFCGIPTDFLAYRPTFLLHKSTFLPEIAGKMINLEQNLYFVGEKIHCSETAYRRVCTTKIPASLGGSLAFQYKILTLLIKEISDPRIKRFQPSKFFVCGCLVLCVFKEKLLSSRGCQMRGKIQFRAGFMAVEEPLISAIIGHYYLLLQL